MLSRASVFSPLRWRASSSIVSTASFSSSSSSSSSPSSSSSSSSSPIRHDWTVEQVREIYTRPLLQLVFDAASVHRQYFNPRQVQQCTLMSIKTGGCTEDCKYCSQSAHNKTFVKPKPRSKIDEILAMATRAKDAGSTRFCMASAWRELGKKNAFKDILETVRKIRAMGLEVCTSLGMVTEEQALQLKEAGLTAYNHNLDTSRDHYEKVITTRTYDDRLKTLKNVRKAGISVCCGGILGLGEDVKDRIALLQTLATLPEHPESVPINKLVSIEGTPLHEQKVPDVSCLDMARAIATARILMPQSMVRLSAGRFSFSEGEQGMLFLAGANSIFTGDTLLTTSNPAFEKDKLMFDRLGLIGRPAFLNPKHHLKEEVVVHHTSTKM